ncbi:hypothetical protein [Cetobacterium ceti]
MKKLLLLFFTMFFFSCSPIRIKEPLKIYEQTTKLKTENHFEFIGVNKSKFSNLSFYTGDAPVYYLHFAGKDLINLEQSIGRTLQNSKLALDSSSMYLGSFELNTIDRFENTNRYVIFAEIDSLDIKIAEQSGYKLYKYPLIAVYGLGLLVPSQHDVDLDLNYSIKVYDTKTKDIIFGKKINFRKNYVASGTEMVPDFSQISYYLSEISAINIEQNIEQTIKTLKLSKKIL